jgi:chromosomal replication initiation ATPase DnaA
MSRQLTFELAHRPALGRDDFLVSPSNAAAVARIDAWPDWPAPALFLSGPAGSGKTHLGEVWRRASNAECIEAHALARSDIAYLIRHKALVVENLDELSDEGERALFHLVNAMMEEGSFLLLVSRMAPGHMPVRLPDLASRLKAMPHAELGAPDDALLSGVLVKLFNDRQLQVPEPLITYLTARIERSVASARDIVQRLDTASLSGNRPVTVKLASEILGT